MKRIRILFALLLLASFTAEAATVTLTWTNPTTNTDGSALPASAITRTRLEYGSCNGTAFGTKAGEFISAGNDTTEVSPTLAPGTYCFRAATTANGQESAFSNVASKLIPQPSPGPPTNLTVSDPTAYEIRTNALGNLVASRIGVVELGTICGTETRTVAGVEYRRVQSADLVNWPTKLPAEIWARCG